MVTNCVLPLLSLFELSLGTLSVNICAYTCIREPPPRVPLLCYPAKNYTMTVCVCMRYVRPTEVGDAIVTRMLSSLWDFVSESREVKRTDDDKKKRLAQIEDISKWDFDWPESKTLQPVMCGGQHEDHHGGSRGRCSSCVHSANWVQRQASAGSSLRAEP